MLRGIYTLALCLVAAPLVGGLAGCGGDKPKPKPTPTPAKTDEGTPATTTPSGGGAKAGAKNAAGASAAAEGWGTIKGTLVLDGPAPEAAVLVKKGDLNVKDAERCAVQEVVSEELVVNKDNNGIKWVMVSINKPTAIAEELKNPTGEVELGQEFCHFIPHVLPYRQGQKLKVTSSDPIGHNTNMQPFKNPTWNQLLPSAADGEKSELDGPEYVAETKPIKVQCNIHGWMSAYVFVFDHPYYAVTDENGAFEIKNVPAGNQKLTVWQEKIGYGEGLAAGKEITVKAGETTDLGKITLKTK